MFSTSGVHFLDAFSVILRFFRRS